MLKRRKKVYYNRHSQAGFVPSRLQGQIVPLLSFLPTGNTAANQAYSDAQVINTSGEGAEYGQLIAIIADGGFSVVSGKLVLTPQTTPAWGDSGLYGTYLGGQPFHRANEITFEWRIRSADLTGFFALGVADRPGIISPLDTHNLYTLVFNGGTIGQWERAGLVDADIGTIAINTDYVIRIALSTTAAVYSISGGAYGELGVAYTVLATGAAYVAVDIWLFICNYSTAVTMWDIKTTPKSSGPLIRAVFLGDSITAGSVATTEAQRWVNIVAATKGWSFRNAGIGSTILQNTVQNTVSTIGGASDDNTRDRVSYAGVGYEKVFILCGPNDMRLNDVAITVANFENDLGEVVDILIAAGTAAGNIWIGSVPYIAVAQYGFGPPWDAATALKHTQYVAACAAVAAAKSVNYVDVYQWMADNGDESLVDGVHPNDAGHAAIAVVFLAAIP